MWVFVGARRRREGGEPAPSADPADPRCPPPIICSCELHFIRTRSVMMLTSSSLPSHVQASNLRSFYLQVSGLGPTSGEGTEGAGTRWARNTSWASRYLTVSANWDVSVQSLHAARALGWSVTLTTHGSPRWRERTHVVHPKRPLENLTAAMEAQAAAGLSGAELLMEYICEDDSAGVGFPQDLLRLSRAAGFSNGATVLRPEDAMRGWTEYVAEANVAIDQWSTAQRHARIGFPSSAHSVAPFAECVLGELTNDDVGSLAPALAFLRGAARQYNTTFGIDLSLWWGVINGCVQDLPTSLHRRAMALGYVAGAGVVSIEGCGWMDPATGLPNRMAMELDRFGRLLVGSPPPAAPASTLTRNETDHATGGASGGLPPPARGRPDASVYGVSLVLPPDLGWSERPSYAAASPTLWSYANVPATSRRGAAAVDGLLRAAYPGTGGGGFLAFPFGAFADGMHPSASPFARSSVAPPYTPNPMDAFHAQSNLPFGRFHDRNQLHEWVEQDGGRDPAPYRPMADSRWGDLIDVLVADENETWADAISHHHQATAVVLWANSSTSPTARDSLHSYAERGGTVIVAAGAVGPEDKALTGLVPNGELRAVRAWRWKLPAAGQAHADTAGTGLHTGYFFTATTNWTSPSVQVVAVSEPEGWALIVRHPVGRGCVYTVLNPWFGSRGLDAPALMLLDHVITPIQPVAIVEGVPALYWTSTHAPDGGGRVAAISNNAGAHWVGKVQIRVGDHRVADDESAPPAACTRATCSDAWTGEDIACILKATADALGFEAAVVALTIEAYDVVIVKVACA